MDKKRNRLGWGAAVWLASWLLGLFSLDGAVWKALWLGLATIYVASYFFFSKIDVDSPKGLHRASNVLLGLTLFQFAAMIFLALRFGVTR